MSTAPVVTNKNAQAGMPRSMVPDPEWFDSNRMKFEDWQRGIRLFLKSNRVTGTNNRITAVLACLKRNIADIYTQKKLNEIDDEEETQIQEEFVREIKNMFSDKMKTADAEQKIETFKQGKKNIIDFMIEFKALATKTDTDELYAIFLLKKNIQQDIIKTILEYLPIAMPEILKEWKVAILSVRQGYKSTEGCHDYKTNTEVIYSGRGQPMDIGRFNNNFKDRKPKCFNYNKYRYMIKEYRAKKKERETRKYFKCDKKEHIAKDCKGKQTMKN